MHELLLVYTVQYRTDLVETILGLAADPQTSASIELTTMWHFMN